MRWALLACIVALVGCGEKPEPVVTAPAAESNGTGVLFSYEAGNHLHRYGGRVFKDGRYELYSTEHPNDKPEWTTFAPFTAKQVDAIAGVVDKALDANLPGEIKGHPGPDAARATFRLRGHRIVVDNYPADSPKPLERILDRIADLRKQPPVPTVWRLWSHGQVVKLEARCDIGDVDVLGRLRDAIFMADAKAAKPSPTSDPPAKTPLVAIQFDDPKGTEHLEVFADGRRLERSHGHATTEHLEAAQLNAIRAALAATDWAKLPSRLC